VNAERLKTKVSKEDAMKELARTLIPRFALALLISLAVAVLAAVALGEEGAEPPGSDVFTSPREALLREKPSPQARVVGRLPQGTRLSLIEARPAYLRVQGGWISREVVVVFVPDAGATRELVTVGRTLGRTDAQRRLAAALLLRAAERLRDAKTPDPEVEILLGETTEGLAAAGGPFPPELGIVERPGAAGTHAFYGGAAFQRALELLGKDPTPACARLRERATAGALRAQFPERSNNLTTLTQESVAWLTLAETAEDPAVLRAAAERAGTSSLALGRYLLALGKADELTRLQERVRFAGARVQTLVPGGTEGRRLNSRGVILRAMGGNGTATFPQEVRVSGPVRERLVRIDGKLGALQLTVETRVGSAREVAVRKAAVPILPVPGSLRIAPDGKSVAWVEVVGPSLLVPVITSLDRDEPAREIAFLSDGRPLRDRALAHCMASLAGFSKDGQRLGMEIEAWNDTPGPAPRYSVVSVATGELLFETSKDMKSFSRLLQ
jgi:hypothetical protein